MDDQSFLDRKYLIDGDKFNCPFCNRHSIVYKVANTFAFEWALNETRYGYIIRCQGCENNSLHLSKYWWDSTPNRFNYQPINWPEEKNYEIDRLDYYFFYHHPTGFFTLDSRIPRELRALISEADGCRKFNYLVGASGALRKSIYKFLKLQGAKNQKDENQNLVVMNYEDQIKWVKSKHKLVPEELFSALSNIQDMVSEELHEEKDWEPWTSEEFDYMISAVKALLHEVYVSPEERKELLQRVLSLKPIKTQPISKEENSIPVRNS